MHSTGPLFPGTVANVGSGPSPWSPVNNVKVTDGVTALSSFASSGDYSDKLDCTNFGFNVPSIAIIDGIEVDMIRSGIRAEDASMGLYKMGSPVGSGNSSWPASLDLVTYGGSTDLWDTTWSPSDINDSSFGLYLIAHNTGGTGQANIDSITITVYWHYDAAVSPAAAPRREIYKVYSVDGRYIGNLPSVISQFGFADEINTAGTRINIEVGISADTSANESDYIISESGDYILTESGDYLRTESAAEVVALGASSNSDVMIKNGNRIVVYEYNYYYPNGHAMFNGEIERIDANFGSSTSGSIRLTVVSDGYDFDNYITRGSPFVYTTDQSQLTGTSTYTVNENPSGVSGWNRYGQSWLTGAGITGLGAISIKLNGNATVTIAVYSAVNGTYVGSTTQSVNTAGVAALVTFGFATPLTVLPLHTYFFTIAVASGQSMSVYYSSSDPYAYGEAYYSSYSGGSGGGTFYVQPGKDLYFSTAYATAQTTCTYNSKDPTTGIVAPVLLDYNSRGGRITEGVITATGTTTSYTFNTNTILEAIRACLSMCPSGYYWRVDPGSNTLDMTSASITPDFVFEKGRHIQQLKIGLTIENIVNNVLFTGGDTGGGVNLYKEYSDPDSIAIYGNRLNRRTDNRVTVSATADAFGNSEIAEFSNEQYEVPITITDEHIDTSLLTPGKVVQIVGYNTFVDTLMLQIVRREYMSGIASLTLGVLPPRLIPSFEKLTRGLIAQQTVANPSSPS